MLCSIWSLKIIGRIAKISMAKFLIHRHALRWRQILWICCWWINMWNTLLNSTKIISTWCLINIGRICNVSLALIIVHRYVNLFRCRCTRCMLYVTSSMKIRSMHVIWHRLLHVIFRIIMMCIIKSIIWIMTSRCNMHTITISSNINMRICGTSTIIISNMLCICVLYLRCGVVISLWSIRITRHEYSI
jgi:hypothetical protein